MTDHNEVCERCGRPRAERQPDFARDELGYRWLCHQCQLEIVPEEWSERVLISQ